MDKSRTELLIGKENIELISKKKIAIVGVGGVGGQVAVSLARCGIEHMCLIDFDTVAPSNCNRQVVAKSSTIGKNKVDVLKNLILDINSLAKVDAVCKKISKENVENLINESFDLVVDAIDSVNDKVELICYCKSKNINIISAMGAGNRFDVPQFYMTDIYKTHDDGLAKIVRKKLRENNVKSLDVVVCNSKPVKIEGQKIIGSIAYYPAMCGLVICSEIINKILRKEI